MRPATAATSGKPTIVHFGYCERWPGVFEEDPHALRYEDGDITVSREHAALVTVPVLTVTVLTVTVAAETRETCLWLRFAMIGATLHPLTSKTTSIASQSVLL